MSDIDFQTKFRQAIKKIGDTGKTYALKKGVSWQLQELKRVILSEIMKDLPDDYSGAEKERWALRDPKYRTHIEGTSQAITEEHLAAVEYDKAEKTFEALRSLCSMEKKQISEFGG